MKVKSKYASAIIISSLFTNYCTNSVALAYDFAVSKTMNQNLSNAVADARVDFENYKATGNLVSLEKSIAKFGDIAKFIESEKEITDSSDNLVYQLFLEQREELYLIANETGSGKYIIDYAQAILNGWIHNRHMTTYVRLFLLEGIIEYNKDKIESINEELEKIEKYHYFLASSEWENPEDVPSREWFEEMSSQIPDNPNQDFSGPPHEYDTGTEPAPPSIEDFGELDNGYAEREDSYSSNTFYEKKGNKCVLIKRTYKNDVLIETTQEDVPKADYVYCGIYDYIFENTPPGKVELDEEYINTNQNIESDNYVYYTVNKNKFNPYYYNSGIRAGFNGELSYNQLKDVLYQISMKTKGFSTDSNEKSLTIIEGKPIVVSSEQDIYSKQQVESLLDSFKFVDIKIQKYTDETTSLNNELIDYIKENKAVNFVVDGNDFSITEIEADGSVLMVSLNEIAQVLNLKVENKSDVYTVNREDSLISFSINSLTYKKKDSQEKQFLSKPKKKGNGVYIDLKTLCEEMGYTIEWDSEELKINVNKRDEIN